jgi:pimeloyl-ACP methyl ester carboxylesterase
MREQGFCAFAYGIGAMGTKLRTASRRRVTDDFGGVPSALPYSAGSPDAPLVLFLHGSGQTRHSWRKALAEAVRLDYRAVSLDLRGHGDSETVTGHEVELGGMEP